MEIENRVRWYQAGFWNALTGTEKDRLIAIWHRRAGKDHIVMNGFRELAFKRPGTYWHCFPEYAQARKAVWNGINGHTGKRWIDEVFPPRIRKRTVDNDMFIEFVNGATWQLLGSDRYDATVGAGPVAVAYSEWALCNPAAWAYHSPMIRETKGKAAFITTPRGRNHAHAMYERGLKSDRWFAERLTVEDTGALDAEELKEALQEYQDVHGIDLGLALFEQEYLCSFNAAMIGAYWGAELSKAERQGRVREVEIDQSQPVHHAWDLGKATNNPVWCFQVIGGQPRIVDIYMPETDDLGDWCDWLRDRGYNGTAYVPHDIMVTEWGSKKTRLDKLQEKWKSVRRIPKVSVADGLQAGRETINKALFHSGDDERGERMETGISGLQNYRREWDDELKTFRENPVKDWAEHIGSAFRYLGMAWREVAPVKPKKEKPADLRYEVKDGRIVGNMTVKEAVDAMVRRRRMND